MSRAQREAFLECAEWLWWIFTGGISLHKIRERAEAEALRRYPDVPLETVRERFIVYLKDEGIDGMICENCTCTLDDFDLCCLDSESGCRPGVLVDGEIVERGGK